MKAKASCLHMKSYKRPQGLNTINHTTTGNQLDSNHHKHYEIVLSGMAGLWRHSPTDSVQVLEHAPSELSATISNI